MYSSIQSKSNDSGVIVVKEEKEHMKRENIK